MTEKRITDKYLERYTTTECNVARHREMIQLKHVGYAGKTLQEISHLTVQNTT